MGVMRFVVHPATSPEEWPEHRQAYISGFDGRIFPTRVEFDGTTLSCRRSYSDSGKVSVPWPVEGIGRPVLTTTSLREQEKPYFLPLELARGKLSQIRDQAAIWEMARMMIPSEFTKLQSESFKALARASACRDLPDQCAEASQRSLQLACQAANILTHAYTLQRMASIRRSSSHAPNLLGATVDASVLTDRGRTTFFNTFNTASVPIRWTDIEKDEGDYDWSLVDQLIETVSENRLIIRGGPLVGLDDGGLPEWLEPWSSDFLNLISFVCDFVDTAVSRYTGRVRIWEISAAGNYGGALNLNEEQCLSLTARTLEAGVRTDSDSQFFIRIEQPWGEYQRFGHHQLTPFQFVDALVRSNLGLTGVSLDINVGYTNRACLPHDILSISKLIDLWSLLGLQIHVNLACPSAASHDPLADPTIAVRSHPSQPQWTEERQAQWMGEIVPLLMAKPSVTGVFLDQFSDGAPHRHPHSGLLTADGHSKKMLETLQQQSRFETQ
ncbi:endo-1,4-beta-xylanase [Thalassoglobus sp. JC818]|uniref:endo-1,4-beta-xylanase n=1 Tax=Thalassoglobus sp. JC818 TaxID=3232136 RepID=UPI00345836B2